MAPSVSSQLAVTAVSSVRRSCFSTARRRVKVVFSVNEARLISTNGPEATEKVKSSLVHLSGKSSTVTSSELFPQQDKVRSSKAPGLVSNVKLVKSVSRKCQSKKSVRSICQELARGWKVYINLNSLDYQRQWQIDCLQSAVSNPLSHNQRVLALGNIFTPAFLYPLLTVVNFFHSRLQTVYTSQRRVSPSRTWKLLTFIAAPRHVWTYMWAAICLTEEAGKLASNSVFLWGSVLSEKVIISLLGGRLTTSDSHMRTSWGSLDLSVFVCVSDRCR